MADNLLKLINSSKLKPNYIVAITILEMIENNRQNKEASLYFRIWRISNTILSLQISLSWDASDDDRGDKLSCNGNNFCWEYRKNRQEWK